MLSCTFTITFDVVLHHLQLFLSCATTHLLYRYFLVNTITAVVRVLILSPRQDWLKGPPAKSPSSSHRRRLRL